MKKYSILIILMIVAYNTRAQNRENVASFSQFQQYFNPALTGYQGSAIKSYYRDQFASYDNAPRTLFVSGEMNLEDISKAKSKLHHGLGVSLLRDTYGALAENQFNLSYSSGIQLTDKLNLRAGVAFTYGILKMDDSKLVMDEDSDPSYMALLSGDNNANRYGVNVGVALSSDDYYIGYSLNNAVRGNSAENQIAASYPMQHIAQAGYRRSLDESVGLIINALYSYNNFQKGIAEAQLKAVLKNTFWVGAGYRNNLAYTFNAGVSIKQLRVGYIREINTSKANGFYRGVNEIMLSYNFSPIFNGNKLTIW